MEENVFNNMPTDHSDILIQNWEKTEDAKALTNKERIIWKKAFTWALDQGVAKLIADEYAEVVFNDDWEVKFKRKLFDKFNINTRD